MLQMNSSSAARLALTLFVATFAGLARTAADTTWQIFQHEHVLGTSLELKFAARDTAHAAAAEAAALGEIDRLAKILSSYDATSEFSRWQATHGVAVSVSADLFAVLALFDAWRERTHGALDASAEVAGRLWKSSAQAGRTPTELELDAAVAAVRQTHWRLDPVARTAIHLSDAPLVLNSFTKSFIIERAAEVAIAAGQLESAVVNIGGDLVIRGRAVDAVALVNPEAEAENDAPLQHLSLRDRAVATSGGYRRGVEIGGRWYSHLVDPRTGRPVDHVLSATVVSPRATDAGALATALCVVTPEEGLALVATIADAECLLVLHDGRLLATAGWNSLQNTAAPATPNWVHAAAAKSSGAAGAIPLPAWDPNYELLVSFEIAAVGSGRGKKPFVAIWIEDKDGFPLRTLALWYHGARWLPDLRAWNHADHLRSMAEGTQVVESVASATRGPGKYSVRWDGKDGGGQAVKPGTYTVAIEVAREHGSHQVMRQEVAFTGQPQHFDLPANLEVNSAALDYRRKTAAH